MQIFAKYKKLVYNIQNPISMHLLRYHRHIFSILIWIMGLFLLVILYHNALRYAQF